MNGVEYGIFGYLLLDKAYFRFIIISRDTLIKSIHQYIEEIKYIVFSLRLYIPAQTTVISYYKICDITLNHIKKVRDSQAIKSFQLSSCGLNSRIGRVKI